MYRVCRNKRPGRLIFRSNKKTFQSPLVLRTPPLWKITQHNPLVLCTPPCEKITFLVGAYFGVGVYFGKYSIHYNQYCYLCDKGEKWKSSEETWWWKSGDLNRQDACGITKNDYKIGQTTWKKSQSVLGAVNEKEKTIIFHGVTAEEFCVTAIEILHKCFGCRLIRHKPAIFFPKIRYVGSHGLGSG